MDGGETSHEDVELKSPFPIIPPVKDTKWNTPPHSPDAQSQPLDPPKLFPDIGEEHPCPYFVGPDVNFIRPGQRKKRKVPVVPTPVIPPPVIPPVPVSLPTPPPREPTPKPSSPVNVLTTSEEDEILDACLEECIHGVIWETIAQQGSEMTREMFCALVSTNPKKYILDSATLSVLWRKISKKPNASNWTEPCEQPIDKLKLDVLTSQAYKMSKARYTVTNEGISQIHKNIVSQATSQNLVDQYSSEMEKKLKKQDAKELKGQPPRTPSFLPL